MPPGVVRDSWVGIGEGGGGGKGKGDFAVDCEGEGVGGGCDVLGMAVGGIVAAVLRRSEILSL